MVKRYRIYVQTVDYYKFFKDVSAESPKEAAHAVAHEVGDKILVQYIDKLGITMFERNKEWIKVY